MAEQCSVAEPGCRLAEHSLESCFLSLVLHHNAAMSLDSVEQGMTLTTLNQSNGDHPHRVRTVTVSSQKGECRGGHQTLA